MKSALILVLTVLVLSACGGNMDSTVPWSTSPLSAKEAKRVSFPYAFTGQVRCAASDKVINDFSVDLIGAEPSISAVLNPLGNDRGLFHVSRSPTYAETEKVNVPLLLTADGFKATVFYVDVYTDCKSVGCKGRKLSKVKLSPADSPLDRNVEDEAFTPPVAEQRIRAIGANQVFSQLNESNKFDPALSQTLLNSKNGDELTNILVLLNGTGTEDREELIASLLQSNADVLDVAELRKMSSSAGLRVSQLVKLYPEMGRSLAVSKLLLPYLTPVSRALAQQGKGGVTAELIGNLLSLETAVQSLKDMGSLLLRTQASGLQMGSLLPFSPGIMSSGQDSGGLSRLLQSSLLGELQARGMGEESVFTPLVMPYLRNLVQAMEGNLGAAIKLQFNTLVSQSSPLTSLKQFPKDANEARRFAELLPHLRSLVAGLNGHYEPVLTNYLIPIINSRNPALVLSRKLYENGLSGESSKSRFIEALYPRAKSVWNDAVPRKQLFAAQLIRGALGSDYKKVLVLKDLSGAPALLISAQARDLFKIAQLPNVARLLAVQD